MMFFLFNINMGLGIIIVYVYRCVLFYLSPKTRIKLLSRVAALTRLISYLAITNMRLYA